MIRDHRHRANLEAVSRACAAGSAARAGAGRAAVAAAGGLPGHLYLVSNMALQLIGASGQLISGAGGGRQSEVAIRTAQTAFNRGVA